MLNTLNNLINNNWQIIITKQLSKEDEVFSLAGYKKYFIEKTNTKKCNCELYLTVNHDMITRYASCASKSCADMGTCFRKYKINYCTRSMIANFF